MNPHCLSGLPPPGHCSTDREMRTENGDPVVQGCGFCGPSSGHVLPDWNSLCCLPVFPALVQGYPSPGMGKNRVELVLSSEKAMATHSSTLAWKIPWMEEPGRLQSMGSLSRAQLSDFTLAWIKYKIKDLYIKALTICLQWAGPDWG